MTEDTLKECVDIYVDTLFDRLEKIFEKRYSPLCKMHILPY
jgi:hypothetical protein